MKYLLGVDGGGTKTDSVLCEQNGKVVRRCIGGASSMTGQTEEKAYQNIRETVWSVLGDIDQSDVLGVYVGISGGGLEKNKARYRAMLDDFLSNVKNRANGSDAVNALSSGIGPGDGIIAIAGTGSSVFARNNGEMYQVGGWGYLLGDEGSGYDLGRRALTASLKELDGRGQKTVLSAMCEKKAGCPLRELVAQLYRTDSKLVIASYARILMEAAEQGDAAALKELHEAADDMAYAIQTAAGKCRRRGVVMGGSVWKNALYRRLVSEKLGSSYEMIFPTLPPVYGSVVEAAGLAGITVNEKFKQSFTDTLKEV